MIGPTLEYWQLGCVSHNMTHYDSEVVCHDEGASVLEKLMWNEMKQQMTRPGGLAGSAGKMTLVSMLTATGLYGKEAYGEN